MIKRLDPTFDTKDHGHAGFSEMVKALDAVVEVKKGESDHMLRVRWFGTYAPGSPNTASTSRAECSRRTTSMPLAIGS